MDTVIYCIYEIGTNDTQGNVLSWENHDIWYEGEGLMKTYEKDTIEVSSEIIPFLLGCTYKMVYNVRLQ